MNIITKYPIDSPEYLTALMQNNSRLD